MSNRNQCDEHRVAGDRRCQPRVRDDTDAVAEIRHDGRAKEFVERPAERALNGGGWRSGFSHDANLVVGKARM